MSAQQRKQMPPPGKCDVLQPLILWSTCFSCLILLGAFELQQPQCLVTQALLGYLDSQNNMDWFLGSRLERKR